jgi:RimJ/RimL family protein N-acetyltransferase
MNEIFQETFKLPTGETILLRHIKRADLNAVWKNFNEVVEEDIYPVFFPVETQFEKESWYDSLKRENNICIVAENLELKKGHNVLGQCEISNIEWDASKHVGSLGIIVEKNYRDMGIGHHLIDIAIRESFKLNNKEKIILSCFSTNERAIHLYKELGFKEVGLRNSQFKIEGDYYDELLMELFIEEYLDNQ